VRVSTEGGRQAAVKGQSSALGRRYARALLEVASASSADVPARLRSELEQLVEALETHEELAALLRHPALGPEPRRRLLETVAREAGLSPLMRRTLELLAAHDRLPLLPSLAASYGEELNRRQGVLAASARSAVPLSEAQRRALADALGALVGKKVELEAQLDPTLLGGVLVQLGGRSYDGTLRTQLQALRRRLAAGS
jgi:F-type H+-transporting ATPase subunit delta